ncbi:hypothetical protein D9623_26625 (plasmid) [Azospirillum brasilense]|nr:MULTISPECIES: hypothetical protein [Azospirillum]MDW7555416.1 hypothetical protein [Azospirillum brasilense]MDW7595176.1 hypothetical protein [Azospirillum brasilense]MDW7630329.1 hypothetical protein [Azospirillum brasilense]MDX5949697.1 hypothetical protein [Azospirillum brasilense]QEL94844.1 hypothetical protein D9621_32455 [Azospirillum brasilense]
MPATERTSFERSGTGQHLGTDLGCVFYGCGEAHGCGIDQQVQGALEGHHGFVSAFEAQFNGSGRRSQARPPFSADEVIAGLSAEPLRALQATRHSVGAHLLGAFDALREELAVKLLSNVFAELSSLRRAVSNHAEKLLNSFTNAAVCGVGDFVFHDRHFTHRGLNMETTQTGKNLPETGNIFPEKKRKPLRDILADALDKAIHYQFAPWRGGKKALAATTERAEKTAYNYLSRQTIMSAVDLLMIVVRHPPFLEALMAEVRRRLAHNGQEGQAKKLVSRITKAVGERRRAMGSAIGSAIRPRFRRHKEAV